MMFKKYELYFSLILLSKKKNCCKFCFKLNKKPLYHHFVSYIPSEMLSYILLFIRFELKTEN